MGWFLETIMRISSYGYLKKWKPPDLGNDLCTIQYYTNESCYYQHHLCFTHLNYVFGLGLGLLEPWGQSYKVFVQEYTKIWFKTKFYVDSKSSWSLNSQRLVIWSDTPLQVISFSKAQLLIIYVFSFYDFSPINGFIHGVFI